MTETVVGTLCGVAAARGHLLDRQTRVADVLPELTEPSKPTRVAPYGARWARGRARRCR